MIYALSSIIFQVKSKITLIKYILEKYLSRPTTSLQVMLKPSPSLDEF